MPIIIKNYNCKSRLATIEEIEEYRNEQDLEKRLNLAYEYQITKDDLYPEDYNQIIDDMYRAMEEI